MRRLLRVLPFAHDDPLDRELVRTMRAAVAIDRSTLSEETMSKGKTVVRPLAFSLVILGTLSRLLPHLPNVTAVGASSLFSGARLRGWQAFLVPLATMALTDPILGAMYGFRPFSRVTPFVYAAFALNVCLGRWLRQQARPAWIAGAALAASVQFFLVTNFGVWLVGGGHAYPHTLAGLVTCYVAALPFLGRTMLGDVGYAAVLFGVHEWLSRRVSPPESVGATARAR